MDDRLYKRIKKSASRMFRGRDTDDLAQEAALVFIRLGHTGKTVDQAVIDAARSLYGRSGGGRSMLRKNTLFAEPTEFDINSQQLKQPDSDFESSRIDSTLIDRANFDFEHREGVSYSRKSQLRKAARNKFIRNYLWEHYRENGIESEIEVDWITI